MPCCLMLIKAPGSQRKETFANQSQVFHDAMVLLENIVLFHSSHHSTPHRDTGHSRQCHRGKPCPVKHPSQWARQFNTLCKMGERSGSAYSPVPLLSACSSPAKGTYLSSANRWWVPSSPHRLMPTPSHTPLSWAGLLTMPFSDNTCEEERS